MVKKLILFLLLAAPMATYAQDKIAYINVEDVVISMPDMADLETKMKAEVETVKKALAELDINLQKFAEEANKAKDSMSEEELDKKYEEFQKLQAKRNEYEETQYKELQEKNNQMMAPIRQKVQQAIKDVADENNFTYVIDIQNILYANRNATDATNLVKTKLNIKVVAAP